MKTFDAYSIETLVDASFAIENEPSDSNGGTYFHVLKFSELQSDEDKSLFLSLFEHIGIETPEVLGLVKFDSYTVQWFGSPIICKKKDENGQYKLFLTIGVSRRMDNLEPVTIPVNITNGKITIGKGSFILDKIEREILDKKTKKPMKITTPMFTYLGSGEDDEFYGIQIRTSDLFSWGKFQLAFSGNDINKITNLVGEITKKEYAGISRLFTFHFETNTFPAKGFVIPIFSADHSISGDYINYRLRVDCSDIPGYSTNFGKELVHTSDVGVISISESHRGYSQIQRLLKSGKNPSEHQPWYLWVQGIGKQSDTVPVHLITDKLLAPLQAAMDLQPSLEPVEKIEALEPTTVDVEPTTVEVEPTVFVEPESTDKRDF